MARAALGWTVRALALRAGVSKTTVVRFENGLVDPIPATLRAIRQTFEAAGVEFTNGEAPGVKLRRTL
ncbi:MAG: helix-turn-helix transcriptional regulator [Rhodomicrobium sp.]